MQTQIEEFEQIRLQEENIQLQEYVKSIEEKKLKVESLQKNNNLNQNIKGKKKKKIQDGSKEKDKDTLLQQQGQNSLNPGNKISKINGFAPIINIKTSSKSFAWYSNDDNCFSHINISKQNNLWTWPNNPKDIQKYKVYCDLWNRGYYITSGIKFGGDYLLYPGKLYD
jgi:tRNA-splicing endonuclease subunit Sen34